MNFRHHTLPNGLEIVAECNPEAHSASMGFYVRTGARDETDAVSGVSHFLEHMMFKGTPTRTADDVNREFDEMGAHYNAYTSEENTVYYAAVLPEYLEKVTELWADVLRPALREDDFTTEKKVIIEEIKMYDDQPPFGAHEKCMAAYFGKHPLARNVLGSVQSIADLPVDAMRAYFERRYSPRNISLVAAGRVDFDALVAGAERHCGHWKPFEAARETPRAAVHCGFETLVKPGATQEYAVQLASGPAAHDEDRFAAKLLATILGDDSGSRLYWELVDNGLAEHCSLGHSEYQGTGLYMTYMSCEPDAVADNLQRVLDLYRRAEADGITAAELAQAKSKISARVVLGSERPRGRMSSLGNNWTQRREYRSVSDDLASVEAVSLDDLHAVLAKHPLSQSTTVVVGPLEKIAAPH